MSWGAGLGGGLGQPSGKAVAQSHLASLTVFLSSCRQEVQVQF